jgi:hypothetical protein
MHNSSVDGIDMKSPASGSPDDQQSVAQDIVARLEEAGRVGSLCWEAAAEIERLRECLQHAIDHVGKWQLFTAEEKQTILAEYEEAVRGE